MSSPSFSFSCRLLAFAATALVTLPVLRAAGPPPAAEPASPADHRWAELTAEDNRAFPADINVWPASRRTDWMENAVQELQQHALEFYERHPTDPRRWQAFLLMLKNQRSFVTGYRPGFDENPKPEGMIVDEAARARWQERVAKMDAAMAMAQDVPPAVREERATIELNPDVFRAFTGRFAGDWFELGRRIEGFAARFPESRQATGFESRYLGALEARDAVAAAERARRLAQASPSAGVRALAADWVRASDERKRPVDLRFVAVDGREVDLTKLRGRVVLIDFWATWCGPCIKELPNVKKVYAGYHDRGFEIVGVSLDKEGDRQKLLDFVAQEKMPWPQHYDGRHWKNELAVHYGIKGIPAMFLLDQEGKIVSTNARGEKLEQEVKRLLKL